MKNKCCNYIFLFIIIESLVELPTSLMCKCSSQYLGVVYYTWHKYIAFIERGNGFIFVQLTVVCWNGSAGKKLRGLVFHLV
jgi:hypothetical protein